MVQLAGSPHTHTPQVFAHFLHVPEFGLTAWHASVVVLKASASPTAQGSSSALSQALCLQWTLMRWSET